MTLVDGCCQAGVCRRVFISAVRVIKNGAACKHSPLFSFNSAYGSFARPSGRLGPNSSKCGWNRRFCLFWACCACFYRAGCLDSRGTGFTALDSHGVQFIQPHANSAVSVPVCPDPGQPLISPKVPETLSGEYRLTEAQPVFSIPLRSGSIPDCQGSPLDPRSQTRCCMYRKPYQ